MRARRLNEVHSLGDGIDARKAFPTMEHRRLGKGPYEFMRTLGYTIGAQGQSMPWQLFMKCQMGTMGFIDEDIEPFFVGCCDKRSKVTAHTVIGGIRKDDGLSIRPFGNGFMKGLYCRAEGDVFFGAKPPSI